MLYFESRQCGSLKIGIFNFQVILGNELIYLHYEGI